MSVIGIRGFTSNSFNNNTTGATTIPAGTTTGDVMIFVVAPKSTATDNVTVSTAGWTKYTQAQHSTNGISLAVFTKAWASGDAGPVANWTTAVRGSWMILSLTGAPTSGTIIEASATAEGATASVVDAAVTALTTGAARLSLLNDATAGTAVTPDWRLYELVDQHSGGTTSTHARFWAGIERGMAAGAGGTRTHTAGASSWINIVLWIKPASAEPCGILQSAKNATAGGVTSLAATLNTQNLTAGSTLICAETDWNGTAGNVVSGVSYSGGAFTSTGADAGASSGYGHSNIWYFSNNQSIAASEVITMTKGTSNDMSMVVLEVLGLATTGALETIGTALSPTGTSTSISVTSNAALGSGNRFVVAIASDSGGGTITPTWDNNYIPRYAQNNGSFMTGFTQSRGLSGGATETATFTLSVGGQLTASLAAFVVQSGGGGTTYTVTLSGTLTTSGSLTKTGQKKLSGTLNPSGTLLKLGRKTVAGMLTTAGLLVKQGNKVISGNLNLAGSLTKQGRKTLNGALNITGALTKQGNKLLSGVLTTGGTLVKRGNKLLFGTLTTGGTLTKQGSKVLSGTLDLDGSLIKQASTTLFGALSFAGNLSSNLTSGAQLFFVTIGGTLDMSGDLVKQGKKNLGGTLNTAGNLVKQGRKNLSGTLNTAGSLVKQGRHTLAGTLNTTGSLVKRGSTSLGGSLDLAGNLVKQGRKQLSGALTTSGALTKLGNKRLSGTLNTAGNLVKLGQKSLAGALTLGGTLAVRSGNLFIVFVKAVVYSPGRFGSIFGPGKYGTVESPGKHGEVRSE